MANLADTLKILGQIVGSASEKVLYVVPEGTETTLSSIYICRNAGTNATYRIAVRKNGAGYNTPVSTEQWIAYDSSLWANTTDTIGVGITLSDNDDIVVYSSDGDVVFSCYGVETTGD